MRAYFCCNHTYPQHIYFLQTTYDETITGDENFVTVVEALRREVRNNNASEKGSLERGLGWYDSMTLYIERLHQVGDPCSLMLL